MRAFPISAHGRHKIEKAILKGWQPGLPISAFCRPTRNRRRVSRKERVFND